VGDIITSGAINKLTFINYAFGNIYAQGGGFGCGELNKLESGSTNPSAPDAGTGGDAWADEGRTSARPIDGTTPAWDAPLAGNFFELKKLKAHYPNVKVIISLGGWTWSKNFSAAAATDAGRKQLVSSCVGQFIRGDLPVVDGRGGVGAAKGIFDGIDIDWEFPGGGGQPYNSASPNDKHNFTLLMAEFRAQLDAQGAADGGKHYLLIAAMSPGKDKIDMTEPAQYSQYLDWIDLMTYDFHGGWAATGPTNFNAHLFADPADPSTAVEKTYNTNAAMTYMASLGVAKTKLLMGIPFYGRGWTGVAPGPNNDGLYQTATGPAPGAVEAGINDYKVLVGMAGTRFVHPITKQLYMYTGAGGQWWSYDDASVIATKVNYVKTNGYGGAFSWEIDGDQGSTLASAVWNVR
jgi:chitinase